MLVAVSAADEPYYHMWARSSFGLFTTALDILDEIIFVLYLLLVSVTWKLCVLVSNHSMKAINSELWYVISNFIMQWDTGQIWYGQSLSLPDKRALVMLNFDQSSLSSLIFFDVNAG